MSMQPGLPMPAPNKSVLPKIAIACFVVGAVLVGFFVWRIVVTLPHTPRPIESGRVELTKEGLTIYSSVPVLTPPCQAQDADGNDVPLERETGSETITINGNSWYVVARSAHPVPAGVYSISCSDDETSATYAAGPKFSVLAFVLSILGTIFSFLIFVGLGIVFLVIWGVRKSRTNRPNQPGAPGNYPPPGYPQPGHPQPGYPQPGYPQQPNQSFPPPPPYHPGPNPDRPQDR
jgi:hypothetical protein